MIWDLHVHLSGFEGATPEQRMEHIASVADRMGVHRFCVYGGTAWIKDPQPEQFRDFNDQVLRAVARLPTRAFGFVYLNPKHLDASLAELERCVAQGPMVGIKLWIGHLCSAPELDPIVRRAAELKVPIYQHTWFQVGGNAPGESSPEDLALLASRHPQAPFICGHSGGDWERGLRRIRDLKNVYADLAGSDPVAGYTEMAVRELGPERIIYGSDVGGRSFASQLAKVFGAQIPEAHKTLILGENLRRLLLPVLQAKGVKL